MILPWVNLWPWPSLGGIVYEWGFRESLQQRRIGVSVEIRALHVVVMSSRARSQVQNRRSRDQRHARWLICRD